MSNKANLVLAASLFGISLIVTAVILHHGLTSAADRLAGAVDAHALSVTSASANIGPPVAKSLTHVCEEINRHADILSKPRLTFANPVAVEQPVMIRGPREDGALPVDAGIGK
jgi:hypothetical protein